MFSGEISDPISFRKRTAFEKTIRPNYNHRKLGPSHNQKGIIEDNNNDNIISKEVKTKVENNKNYFSSKLSSKRS